MSTTPTTDREPCPAPCACPKCSRARWNAGADAPSSTTPEPLDLDAVEARVYRWRQLDVGSVVTTERYAAAALMAADVVTLLARVRELETERDQFSAELGFGDNVSEPAASLADMLDPIRQAMATARDHDDCARHCELCGETLAATVCQRCHGLGDLGGGAYSECPDCAGAGRLHDGCVEVSYADLVAERDRLRAELATARADALRQAAPLTNCADDAELLRDLADEHAADDSTYTPDEGARILAEVKAHPKADLIDAIAEATFDLANDEAPTGGGMWYHLAQAHALVEALPALALDEDSLCDEPGCGAHDEHPTAPATWTPCETDLDYVAAAGKAGHLVERRPSGTLVCSCGCVAGGWPGMLGHLEDGAGPLSATPPTGTEQT